MLTPLAIIVETCAALVVGLTLQLAPNAEPPAILQIHREALKSGREAEYKAIEEETARICARLGCPNRYLGVESLTGTKEAWFFNGFASSAERQQVDVDYGRNKPLVAALTRNSKRKAGLTEEPINVFTRYRADLTVGRPWTVGQGRFLVIAVTRNPRGIKGTVFEAEDGTCFVVMPVQTRAEAEAAAASVGAGSNIFAVRPSWSFPAKEWIRADESFWRPRSNEK